MHGIPAWTLLQAAAPILAVAALWWVVSRTDQIIHAVFPHLEWEHSLGWLNIRAERRANFGMRIVRYAIYLLLIDALAGILWASAGFPSLHDWADPWVMGELALRVPTLGICGIIWVLYLGCGLLPRLRAEKEMAALKRYREEHIDEDDDKAPRPTKRVRKSLANLRVNSTLPNLPPYRGRRYTEPGG